MQQPEYIIRLIQTYSNAQASLIRAIVDQEAKGNLTTYQRTLLAQASRVLQQINKYADHWARNVIPERYNRGVEDVVRSLKTAGIATPGYQAFAMLHNDAIDLLVRNAIDDLINAGNFVGRQLLDDIREAGIEAITEKVSIGSTVQQAKENLKGKLIEKGITAIRDRRGRAISLDAYASTVARSTTREATNTATMNHLKALGYDLVKMSSHATTCPICAALQGRVYSLTGQTPGYPVLTQAYGSHANVHPNCRHVIAPYIPALADDPEGDRAFSNRPFDIDERSQAQIKQYRTRIQEQQKLRNDRNQYQRYKIALGPDAPKTFAAFRRIKTADGERWQQMQQDYRDFSNQNRE